MQKRRLRASWRFDWALVAWNAKDRDSHYTSPLLRVNLGIGHDLELLSELEYQPEDGRLGDGALGFKWASAGKPLSLGVEMLGLLPVSSEHLA